MKLEMKLEEFNYGDAAVKLLPKLVEKTANRGAMSRIVQAVAGLPEEMVRSIIDQIPQQEKNGIAASLFQENRERILNILERYLEEHNTGLTIADLSVDEELNLTVELGEIDMIMLVEKFLPKLKQQGGSSGAVSGAVFGMLSCVPQGLWAGILRNIPQENLLEAGVGLLNYSGDTISASATELLRKNGISAVVTGLHAEL